jgi:hypothetical protein
MCCDKCDLYNYDYCTLNIEVCVLLSMPVVVCAVIKG